MSRLRGVPGMSRDLAVTAGLVVAGLLVAGYILAHQGIVFPWEDRIRFSADFEEVPGISPGNGQELRVAGVRVGEITAADVTESGNARLTLELDPDAVTLYENATLELRPKSPLNEMYVNVVDPGGPPAGEIDGGEVITRHATRRPIQLDEVLAHLDERSRTAAGVFLAELDEALATAPETLPAGAVALDRTLERTRSLGEALQERRDLIARLVTDLEVVLSALGDDDERLAGLLADATATLDALAAHDPQLAELLTELPGFTADLGRASDSLVELGGELTPLVDELRVASDSLPESFERLGSTVDALGSTVERARPFLADARPIVANLRAFAADLRPAVSDVRAVTPLIDPATAGLVDFLPDVQDFVYNTNSALSVQDSTGPVLRGLLQFSPETLPIGTPIGGR